MHPNPRKAAPVVLAILALLSLAYWFFVVRPAQAGDDALSASGTIEATQVRINPEIGGRVLDVLAGEGDAVRAGDALVRIDPALLSAQREQAVAALAVARANAEAAGANTDAATAQAAAAEAAEAAAQAALDAANANLDLLEAGATQAQLDAANQQALQAQASYQAALATYAALTAGVRPETVSAAQARLADARAAYDTLVVTLDSGQYEDLRLANSQAESHLDNVRARRADLEGDSRTPQAVLDALPLALLEAQAAKDAAQAALDAAEDETLPFSRQLEAARYSLDVANLALAQAEARQVALDDADDMTQAAKDALQANADDAQAVADAAQTAYDGLNDSDQADQLTAAWNEVQRALTDLNKLARGSTASLETMSYQLDSAEALRNAAQANADHLAAGARPEQLSAARAQVDAAQAQFDSAAANTSAARARLAAAQAQAAAADAQVTAAQAAITVLDVQIAKLTLLAPADGTVLARAIEPGELASPGAPLLVLADLSRLTMTVYLPEDRYGAVTLGQEATVRVDSFPGQAFLATVTSVADRAEFTPRNVQTADGRKTTVFAIELSLDNTDGKLKPGMPADVTFR
ncbi:MAG: efflux RND transporter periplasmic adaptor subunit [Chloroflexota bacterium]